MFTDKCQEIGIIIKTLRVKGELLLATNFEINNQFKLKGTIFFQIDGILVPFFLEYSEIIGINSIVLKINEINDKALAQKYVNLKVFVLKNLLKTIKFIKDELIGLKIINQDNLYIGEIVSYLDIPHNFLISVNYKTKEVLLPFNEKVIIEINKKEKKIKLNISKELLF